MNSKELIRKAKQQGWGYRRGKHHILYAPDGRGIVTVSVTPSTGRAMKNCLAQMRRMGLVI